MVDRFVHVARADGPHGRLGVLWFLAAVGVSRLGLVVLALLFAVVSVLAALQLVRAWGRFDREVPLAPTLAIAGALPLVAALGSALTGLALLASVGAAVATVMLMPRDEQDENLTVLARAGLILRCGAVTGLTAAAVVIIARTDIWAYLALLLLVSGYEIGDYLIGSGSSFLIEGPIAGIAAVLVITFALAMFQLGPFETAAAWVFGGVVAVGAPLGMLAGSALAPTARAAGPAVRRLDAWIVSAPAWVWMLWGYLE